MHSVRHDHAAWRKIARSTVTLLTTLATLVLARPHQGQAAIYRILYSFTGPSAGDGELPLGPLLVGKVGVMYGSTYLGGNADLGTIYQLTPPVAEGAPWSELVVHSFDGSDGDFPQSGLVAGAGGVLYGTTGDGAASSLGGGFSLSPPIVAGDSWTLALLHSFTGNPDGRQPEGSLIIDNKGRLFGTTFLGGFDNGAYGTVFSVSPPSVTGGSALENVVYSFFGDNHGPPLDGAGPFGGLVGANEALYGTTMFGGASSVACAGGCGTIFQILPPKVGGGPWTEAPVYSFTGGNDGGYPASNLVVDKSGVLYGTTPGFACCGSVFSLSPPAVQGGRWTETTLFNFDESSGGVPHAGLVIGAGSALYGTTSVGGTAGLGTVFSLTPPSVAGGQWTETILHSFLGGNDGASPASLVNQSGVLVGTTSSGGTVTSSCPQGCGTVYAVKP